MLIGAGSARPATVIPRWAPADTDGVNGSQTSLLPDATDLRAPARRGRQADLVGLPARPETLTTRFVAWVAGSRAHRVICLVMGIWLLNGFDLVFTLLSHRHGLLQEQNPVARLILGNGTSSIVLFKIGLVLIGSYPLLRFRRLRLAELAAYLVLAAYVLLAIRWSTCFELYSFALPGDVDLAGLENVEVTAPH